MCACVVRGFDSHRVAESTMRLTFQLPPAWPAAACCCSGNRDSVLCTLGSVLDPAAVADLEAEWIDAAQEASRSSSSSLHGGWERQGLLHRPHAFPSGALCPVLILIHPITGNSSSGCSSGSGSNSSSAAQVCLWAHPAAAADALAALLLAAAQAGASETGGCVGVSVLDIRRLEIRGGTADRALTVALAGATAAATSGGHAAASEAASSGTRPQQQAQQQPEAAAAAAAQALLPPALAALRHGEALQVLLPDPRLRKPVVVGAAEASLLAAASQPVAGKPQQQQQPLNLASLQGVAPPLSETALSGRRQQLRRLLLQLDPAPAASSSARSSGLGGQGGQELLQRGYCPAVLVRHNPPERSGIPGRQRGDTARCLQLVCNSFQLCTWR